MAASDHTPRIGPHNPYLADSSYPIAHGRCDQQDNAAVRGPTGPCAVLGDDDISYTWVGPGHFGGLISSPYPDGRRVIWSNGREQILKLDYDTLEVLAALTIDGASVTPVAELEEAVRRDHLHKVVWTGTRLSTDEADGAWTAAYRNGGGNGSGTTPSLMGFGDEDRFVVIGDGDKVVNITLFWRDSIPDDWPGLAGAPSRRIAGIGAADMGDHTREDIQTEQSVTVSGYGAMTVNNDPPRVPDGFPAVWRRHLAFFLGNRDAFRPLGLHKWAWDPNTRTLREAWVNTDVSSPNSVPYVSHGSNLVYTCGARDGQWTIEALDWDTGASAFHYVVGGSRFNTLGGGITLDEEGRLLYGTIFGKVRIDR